MRRAVGPRDRALDGTVGPKRRKAEHAQQIVLSDHVVGRRIGEDEREDALLLQVGLVYACEGPGEDHHRPAVARLHRRVLA